ncbi:MAG: NUDIX hydrolase [Caldilineaceae bacterium]|nr:NUDIX hydrolase [Caldilineaceae bacterium]
MNHGDYTYCPICATPLVIREMYNHPRPSCPACGFVHFRDPKVAVIGLVASGAHVLLIRRAVDPGKGKWALPGGYMDAGEMPERALQREMLEEVNLTIRVNSLAEIFPMAGQGGVNHGIVLAYLATPREEGLPPLVCRDDVDKAGWFTRDSIPTDLAFESTRALLAKWAATKVSSQP